MSGFGAKLKRERELRGITLAEIARASKIGMRMLEAIESDDHKTLPGGVFNRGFVRSYARHIGLNEEDTVNDYLQCLRDDGIMPADEPIESSVPPTKIPASLIGIFLFAIAAIVGVAILVTSHRRETKSSAPKQSASAAPQAKPSAGSSTETVPSVVINDFPPMPAKEQKQETHLAPITLEMAFTASTWVSMSIDGQSQPPIIYQAGDKKIFTATSEIDMDIGNAGGFTYRLNGKPGLPLGNPGKVRRVIFTPTTIPDLQVPADRPPSAK